MSRERGLHSPDRGQGRVRAVAGRGALACGVEQAPSIPQAVGWLLLAAADERAANITTATNRRVSTAEILRYVLQALQ